MTRLALILALTLASGCATPAQPTRSVPIVANAPGDGGFLSSSFSDQASRTAPEGGRAGVGEAIDIEGLADLDLSLVAVLGPLNSEQMYAVFASTTDLARREREAGRAEVRASCDLTGDGTVGVDDLLKLLSAWGDGPPSTPEALEAAMKALNRTGAVE